MVEATNGEAVLPDGTLLGVVRFYYDKDAFEPWATTAGKATIGETKTDVTNVDDWFDGTKGHWLIQYATEEEILKVITDPSSTIMFSFAGQQVYYISGTNEFYWSELLSESKCKIVNAVDPDKADSEADKWSKTTNLLRKLNNGAPAEPAEGDYTPCVSFKLVNSLSFAQGGGGDQAIIVYYDWDNALIGVQGVEPGDARKEVNDFVEKNFIATDVRASKYTVNTDAYYNVIDSVKRIDTYRDETYPAEGPGTAGPYDNSGDDFQLTNKLDYAFYTHPTKRIVLADPDGSWSGTPNSTATAANGGLAEDPKGGELNGDETIQWEPMKAGDWANETTLDQGAVQYPYTNGWAVVPAEKVHSNNVDDVWTTMGGYRGELVDCKPVPVNNDNCDIPANVNGFRNYTTSGESSYFHFQDFSELEKDKVYYVKACYEPGEGLDYTSYLYTPISDNVYYVRYDVGDSTTANALFNGGIYEPDPSKIDTNYTYWWQADGSGTRPAVLTTLKEMLQAAVSSTGVTGSTPNPNAWKTLQADAVNKLFLAKADLPEDQRKAGDGFSKLEHFASDNLDEFKNLMEALVQNAYAAGIVDPTELSWLQTQDGLFNGGVYNASPVGETYWWTEQGDGLRPGEVRFDPDEVIKELLVEASTINRKWTGESVRGDDAKLQEQIAKYLDQLKLKTDGGYAQMTWKQVQAYLMGAGVKADSALNDGDYSWKPSSISESNTISIAGNVEDIIATVQEVLSEDERTKTKSDNCTQVVTDTGDTIIDIENIIESKCGIRFLGCDSILRISYKTVVKNHIEVEGFSHQAAAKATTEKSGWNLQWISITEDPELVIIEMLLPEGLQLAEVQQEAEVTDLEEIFQPGTGEKVDTPVETTEPETESPTPESTDSPEPETSQKPTEETIEPEPSEPTTETPIPEETQKPTETTEPTEPETPSAAQTQKPDGTTATENEEKTPTDGNAGAAEGTQTTDAEETKAPAEETGGSATELPKDETAEVLAVAWVLPPEVLASRAGQASSVQRC